MSKKIMALLAATVVLGLSLGYAAPNAASANTKTKSSTPQKKACCGHCGMKKPPKA
jgi:hypothetical protein